MSDRPTSPEELLAGVDLFSSLPLLNTEPGFARELLLLLCARLRGADAREAAH